MQQSKSEERIWDGHTRSPSLVWCPTINLPVLQLALATRLLKNILSQAGSDGSTTWLKTPKDNSFFRSLYFLLDWTVGQMIGGKEKSRLFCLSFRDASVSWISSFIDDFVRKTNKQVVVVLVVVDVSRRLDDDVDILPSDQKTIWLGRRVGH